MSKIRSTPHAVRATATHADAAALLAAPPLTLSLPGRKR
jgi:hypothetical protein